LGLDTSLKKTVPAQGTLPPSQKKHPELINSIKNSILAKKKND